MFGTSKERLIWERGKGDSATIVVKDGLAIIIKQPQPPPLIHHPRHLPFLIFHRPHFIHLIVTYKALAHPSLLTSPCRQRFFVAAWDQFLSPLSLKLGSVHTFQKGTNLPLLCLLSSLRLQERHFSHFSKCPGEPLHQMERPARSVSRSAQEHLLRTL